MAVAFDLLADSGGFASGRVLFVHASAVHPIALPYPAVMPILSPDRKRVLFSSARGVGIMTLDGQVQALLKGTGACFAGGWLSDKSIVASCGATAGWPPPAGSWHVVTMGTDGQHRRALSTSDPGAPATVSPTTHQVTFGLNGDVYVVPQAGGHARLLVKNTDNVWWSPDGRRLVYSVVSPSGKQLLLANSSGAPIATLATLPGWTNDLSATFSPDGKTIVYSGSADTPHELWKISTTGGKPMQLTTTADFGDPSIG